MRRKMPLLKPMPGDLADRQSILELKINHCNAEFDEDKSLPKGKMLGMTRTLVNKNAVNVAPFIDELDLIRKELTEKWVPDLIKLNRVEAYDKLYDEISEVNSSLWELEDKIRALKAAPSFVESRDKDWLVRVMETSFEITDANDKRAVLVKSINKL